jgi:hypothetical protein
VLVVVGPAVLVVVVVTHRYPYGIHTVRNSGVKIPLKQDIPDTKSKVNMAGGGVVVVRVY